MRELDQERMHRSWCSQGLASAEIQTLERARYTHPLSSGLRGLALPRRVLETCGVIGLELKPEPLLKGGGGQITETRFYSIGIKDLQMALQSARGV